MMGPHRAEVSAVAPSGTEPKREMHGMKGRIRAETPATYRRHEERSVDAERRIAKSLQRLPEERKQR